MASSLGARVDGTPLITPRTPVLPAQVNDCDTMTQRHDETFICRCQEQNTVQRQVILLWIEVFIRMKGKSTTINIAKP